MGTRKIKLRNCNKFTILDEVDYLALKKYKWTISAYGYANRYYYDKINKKPVRVLMHQDVIGKKKGKITDHINRKRLDNRRENLRFCSDAENVMNRTISNNSSSGYKGVSWHKRDKFFRTRIKFKSKVYYLGNFKTAKEGAIAYNNKAKELFGEFACLNKV